MGYPEGDGTSRAMPKRRCIDCKEALAEAEGVPAFAVFTDEQLAAIGNYSGFRVCSAVVDR